jgi:hypothetical protein
MDAILGFLGALIKLFIFLVIVVAVIAFFGYNTLRALSEAIRESWSNIGVVGRKQASLINQLIDVVKGYQESEKLVMLKVSDDMTSANNVAQLHQQSGMVLSTISGMVRNFPELKSNEQYQRLIDSIQACEAQLESARQIYNKRVKDYNTKRSSIPTVFYATTLGFKVAPYLEFNGEFDSSSKSIDMGTMKSFSCDDDGERLNALLGQAGNKLRDISSRAVEVGKGVTQRAVEGGKILAEKTQEKIREHKAASEVAAAQQLPAPDSKVCGGCGAELFAENKFCGGCGAKL